MNLVKTFVSVVPMVALSACALQPTPVPPTLDPNATPMYRLMTTDPSRLIWNPNKPEQVLSAEQLRSIYNNIPITEVDYCTNRVSEFLTPEGLAVKTLDIAYKLNESEKITLRYYLSSTNTKTGYDGDLTLINTENGVASFNLFIRQNNLNFMIAAIRQECAHGIQKADLIK
jgi:hypothetical protein